MTLREALDVALAAYDEDDGEREAILAALTPIVLDRDRDMFRNLIEWSWARNADQIREAIAAYQAERAEIDAEIAAS